MKLALKILTLICIVAVTMISCETSPSHPGDHQKPSEQDDLNQIHEYIRPTKPIKIPDTLTITNIAPTTPDIQLAETDSIH